MQQEYREENDEIKIDVIKIVKACLKKFWVILLVGALLGSGMFIYNKRSYVPQYKATVTMYAHISNQTDAAQASIDMLTGTCIAVLPTRMTLEEVIETADLDISYKKIAGMITSEAIAKSPMFTVTVTGKNPEEITTIANTTAYVLPGKVETVYGPCDVGVVDYALVPTAPSNSDNAVKGGLVMAVLGAMLTCAVIACKVVYTDNKASRKTQ